MLRKNSNKNIWELLVLLGLIGLSFYFIMPIPDHSGVTIFEERDYSRAYSLWHGQAIYHGPELSAGGYTPGPFLYTLMAIPQMFGGNGRDQIFFMLGLFSLSVVVIWYGLRRRQGFWATLLVCGLFSGWSSHYTLLFKTWSANYQPIFSFAIYMSLINTFIAERKNTYWWYLTCLLMALAIQIHMSAISYVVPFLIMQIVPIRGIKKLPWRSVGAGLMLFVVILFPFLWWNAISENASEFVSPPTPLKGYLRAIARLLDLKSKFLLAFHDERLIEDFMGVRDNTLLRWLFYFCFAKLLLHARQWRNLKPWKDPVITAAFTVMVGLFISLAYFVATKYYRYYLHYDYALLIFYGVVCAKIILIPISLPSTWSVNKRDLIHNLIPLCAIMVLLTATPFARHKQIERYASKLFDPISAENNNGEEGEWVSRKTIEQVCKHIHTHYNFELQEIFNRLSTVNLFIDLDLRRPCEDAVPDRQTRSASTRSISDGSKINFLLFRIFAGMTESYDWKTWLIASSIPEELKEGLKNGTAHLAKPIFFRGAVLLPYELTTHVPVINIHNRGWPYGEIKEDKWIKQLPWKADPIEVPYGFAGAPDATAFPQLSTISWLWDYCGTSLKRNCRIVILADFKKNNEPKDQWQILIKILGTPLTQRHYGFHEKISLQWNDVYIDVICGNVIRQIPIATQLANVNYANIVDDSSLMSPVSFRSLTTCAERPMLRFGFKSMKIYRDFEIKIGDGSVISETDFK